MTEADGLPLTLRALAVGGALFTGVVACLLLRSAAPREAAKSRPRLAMLLLGASAAVWLGYAPFFPTDLRHDTYRTFLFSTPGAAVACIALLGLLSTTLRVSASARRRALVISGMTLVGLGMTYVLEDMRRWDLYALDEQKFMVSLIQTVPAVKSGTLLVILETKAARFPHKYYVWYYQNAARLIYRDPDVHVVLCFRRVPRGDTERSSCEFGEEGLRIRNPMDLKQDTWPYDRLVLIQYQPDGRMEVQQAVPGLPVPGPRAYEPRALYASGAPLPSRLFTLLGHARELVPRGSRE